MVPKYLIAVINPSLNMQPIEQLTNTYPRLFKIVTQPKKCKNIFNNSHTDLNISNKLIVR